MQFNYNKLRGRIKELFDTQDSFADSLGIGRVSLSQRLNGKIEFSQSEIMDSCRILKLNPEDIPIYFFTKEV